MQEIKDIIDSNNRMERLRKKDRVSDIFVLAQVTANRILHGFNSKSSEDDLMQPWHIYPDLFEDMSREAIEQRENIETENRKARLHMHAEAWNKRFREEQENGSGKTGSESHGGDVGRTEETEKDP